MVGFPGKFWGALCHPRTIFAVFFKVSQHALRVQHRRNCRMDMNITKRDIVGYWILFAVVLSGAILTAIYAG